MIRPLAFLLPSAGLGLGLAVGVANSAPVLAAFLGGSVLLLSLGAVGGHWLDVWLKRRNEAYRDGLEAAYRRDRLLAWYAVQQLEARQDGIVTYRVER